MSDLAQCAEEVKYYVQDFVSTRLVPAIDGGVLKSDNSVDQLLKDELCIAASALREDLAGWNVQNGIPGDLVDPSLFPLVFEKTKVLRSGPIALYECISRCGEGQEVFKPPKVACQSDSNKYPNSQAWSKHFQWLPFDVRFEQGASRYVFVGKIYETSS